MRRAHRTDANHAEIRDALRESGYLVIDMSDVGKGFPDLAVQSPGNTPWCLWLEVKDGSKPPSARKITKAQERWHKLMGASTRVVTSKIEAMQVCLEYFHKPINRSDN